jgi:ketosteroid isomerase-like protein
LVPWATAVRAENLDGVVADHSDDIQMFDVPPPMSPSPCSVAGPKKS